jgi:hypothetical protein
MHSQRLKDMKQMQRDPMAADKARRQERKENEKAGLISIKLDSTTSGEKKKSGFKSAFKPIGAAAEAKPASGPGFKKVFGDDEDEEADELANLGYELYDPRNPTSCGPDCPSKKA